MIDDLQVKLCSPLCCRITLFL